MGDNGDKNGEKDAKGKGKDKQEHAPDTEQQQAALEESEPGGALLSRVAKSAASLPSALFSGAPQASGLAAIRGSEKAESSRASRAEESLSRVGETSTLVRPNIAGSETLKSGSIQAHVAAEEASFSAFLDSTGPWIPTEPTSALEESWRSSTHVTASSRVTGETPGFSLSVAEQQAHDGQDVVNLLSSFDDGDISRFEDETLSPSEMSNLRRALFGEGDENSNGRSTMWDNTLNFTPAYLRETGPAAHLDLGMHMGTADRDEAWQAWIGQWSRVLTEYQDEVWGDLGSLVEQARDEVKQLEQTGGAANDAVAPALLRLRAILGHLRGSPSS